MMSYPKERALFSHYAEEPTTVGWAEVGTEEEGWWQCYIGFGVGQGAIRCSQLQFPDDGSWSQPYGKNIEIAGGLEVNLRPELRRNMRAYWEPTQRMFRPLTFDDPNSLFGGSFTQPTGSTREYFTNSVGVWNYLAKQLGEHGLLRYLPAMYYRINLSQATELSPEHQDLMGPLAGDFALGDTHISDITHSEFLKVQTENVRLTSLIARINSLHELAAPEDDNEDPTEAANAANVLAKRARHRGQWQRTPGSVVLDIANFSPLHELRYDTEDLKEQQQVVELWQNALMRLRDAEQAISTSRLPRP